MSENWRNRIVGEGEQPASQFLAHPDNAKYHPLAQREAMKGILREIGWVQRVIVSKRTGFTLDGHERIFDALQEGDQIVPFIVVDVTEEEEKKILATFDPLGQMAQYDKEKLDALLREVQTGEAAVQQMLEDLAKEAGLYEEDAAYSRKIESPVYEPSVAKPAVSELFDDSKTQALVADIERAEGIAEEERHFLKVAAQRHTVLHFGKIADYYAHSNAVLQRLMEDNALVIIDFGRAIELGFVELTKNIVEQVRDEYGE